MKIAVFACAFLGSAVALKPHVVRMSAAIDAVEIFRKRFGPSGTVSKTGKALPATKTDKELLATFKEISKLYDGDLNALKIVEANAVVLAYDSSRFASTKEAFLQSELCAGEKAKYSEKDIIGMVIRNPGLIALNPTGFGGAINSKEDTMAASYAIAITRPFGSILLSTLLFLLLTPLIKALLAASGVDL